jgi:hypothetical protein
LKQQLIAILALSLLAGCTNKSPLVFISKTSVGVDVSAPGTGTGEFGASIGVSTFDGAYVPVVEIADKTKFNEVKSGESLTPEERKAIADELGAQIHREAKQIDTFQAKLADPNATAPEKTHANEQIALAQQHVKTLSENLGNVLSRNDALSVFSAFDSNTLLRSSEAGQGIGKVFATGLAAQNVSRNFSQQAQASANCKEKIAPTAAALAAKDDQASKDLAVKLLDACQ